MKGFNFGASLTQKSPTPEQQIMDIRSILPPPPTVYLRRAPPNQPENSIYILQESIPKQLKKIISQAEHNESISILDLLILLRKGKQLSKYNKDKLNNGVLCCYLGIMYYKTGLLEQSFQQFLLADTAIKQHIDAKRLSKHMQSFQTQQLFSSLILESKWLKIRGRIHLQLCILLSEIERHQLALKHAQVGIKILFQVLINYFLITRGFLINKSLNLKLQPYVQTMNPKNMNTLSIINKFMDVLKDLKHKYLSKNKLSQLQTQNNLAETYHIELEQPNIQEFIKQVNIKSKWVLENKILNQVQMEIFNKNEYLDSGDIGVNDTIQLIVLLIVSFYCLSTQSRFIEKQTKFLQSDQVLESENWLSRALEIAYIFLPAEAPILGQVYSVHDKFYGLGKQPIPQEGEIGGHIKFLKQMRKVSSVYDKKTTTLCAPILIRVNQSSSFSPQKSLYEPVSISKHVKMRSLTMDLNQSRLKNNSKRSSLQKIYKKNNKRLIKPCKASSSLQYRDDLPRLQHQRNRPISTQMGSTKLTRLINPKINIQINNNINLFISNPNKSFDDNFITLQQKQSDKEKRLGLLNNRKVILKLVPETKRLKESTFNKRNIYHIKRKSMGIKDLEFSQL